jgi:hypothetical protein
VPPVEIGDARLDVVIGRTLRQVGHTPQSGRLLRWLLAPRLLPVMHYAVPMMLALVMGLAIDGWDNDDLPVTQFSRVMLSSSLLPSGS